MIVAVILFMLSLVLLWNSGRFDSMRDLWRDYKWSNQVCFYLKGKTFLGRDLEEWYAGATDFSTKKWNQKWLWTQDYWHFVKDMSFFCYLQASMCFWIGCYLLNPSLIWVVGLIVFWEVLVPFVDGAAFTWYYHYKYAPTALVLGNFWDFVSRFLSFKDKVS
jgi:hypothetical protein